jgi:large subunit ribosomal protein L2
MVMRTYKPYTPSIRNRTVSQFQSLGSSNFFRKLISGQQRHHGRNNRGIITIHHRGGGHKRLYRHLDFKRNKIGISGTICSIEYDPNRNARICLVHYEDGEKRYILHPRGLQIGDTILSSPKAPILSGNTLPLSAI